MSEEEREGAEAAETAGIVGVCLLTRSLSVAWCRRVVVLG